MTLLVNLGDYIKAFLGGLLVSFTPCVYPLVPVVLGVIGAHSTESRLHGFFLSAIYVTGLAVTYSVLGLSAALSGRLFGEIATHPLSYLFTGIIFIAFGLAFLDMFHISLPISSLQVKIKPKGFLSVFFLGLVSGLVVGPCTAPALGAILVYISTRQNIIYGITLMFTFAYGLGTILILAGTFSAVLINLPKSGQWLIRIKQVCGIILILSGIYFFIKIRSVI
jgi:thiol:disulfide interchange protein DsbD